MGEPEIHEDTAAERWVRVWRMSERKKMVETIEDLIQSWHKAARSQYAPSA